MEKIEKISIIIVFTILGVFLSLIFFSNTFLYAETWSYSGDSERANGDDSNGVLLSAASFIIIILILIVVLLSVSIILSYRSRKLNIPLPVTKEGVYDKKDEKNYAKEVYGIKNASKIRNDLINNSSLLDMLNDEGELNKIELNLISEQFLQKVDTLKWDKENQKIEFISEMLALTPDERDDIINYMIEKSNENKIFV